MFLDSSSLVSASPPFPDQQLFEPSRLNSEKVMELFIKTAKEHGTTVIMVTHEPTIAAYADREIIVRDGQISGAEAAVNPAQARADKAKVRIIS